MKKIGQLLRQERMRRKLSLADVEKASKIKATFLDAIERGEYNKLPSRAHAQGFVVKYAEFLGISKQQAILLFKREVDEAREFRVLPKGFSPEEEFSLTRRRFSFAALGITVIVVALVSYLLFQYRYAIFNPPLSITTPSENQQVHSQTVTVSGSTDANATLTINNSAVAIDDNGDFKKDVVVFPGQNTIHIAVTNKFGKQTIVDRHISVITQ